MEKKIFNIRALYADHHVSEVRRILFELPGVEDVYASSAFQIVEVTYDQDKINDLEIAVKLDEAGYLGEWSPPIEHGEVPPEDGAKKTYSRQTIAYQQTRQTVGFAQNVSYLGRPLWPCPGMGVIKSTMED